MSEEKQLRILESRRSAFFERLQLIYKSSSKLSNDTAIENFLCDVESLDDIRESYLHTLEEINSINMSLNEEFTPNHKTWLAFEEVYCRIKRQVSKLKPTSLPHVSKTESVEIYSQKPRLPALEIPMFSGDQKNWPIFYACFRSTVHENSSLTDSQKLFYLVGRLSGKALTVCDGISLCESNYLVILKALVQRYEDKRLQANTYLDNIFNLPKLNTATAENLEKFVDTFSSSISALKNLKLKSLSEFVLMYVAFKKLDIETVRSFEMLNRDEQIPPLDSLLSFVREQVKILERTQPNITKLRNQKGTSDYKSFSSKDTKTQTFTTTASLASHQKRESNCSLCKKVHEHLYSCSKFRDMSPFERFKFVKSANHCFNCLSSKHRIANCNSQRKCHVCDRAHHSMLHFDKVNLTRSDKELCLNKNDTVGSLSQVASTQEVLPQSNISLSSVQGRKSKFIENDTFQTVLLATALVNVVDSQGLVRTIRCLLDNGSQSNFMTESCATILGLQSLIVNSVVKGIGGSEKAIKGVVSVNFSSRFNQNCSYQLKALLVDKITDSLPVARIDTSDFSNFLELPLADDTFFEPAEVDMLIGAALFPTLMLSRKVKALKKSAISAPQALQTTLGYVILGSASATFDEKPALALCAIEKDPLDNYLRKFWELEETQRGSFLSPDEQACEEFFCKSVKRDDTTGRYIVSLPFKGDASALGDSLSVAKKRFGWLERRFEKSPTLRETYNATIREYLSKGYLSRLEGFVDELPGKPSYYIPHLGVIKEDRATTKLRIVLDASCKSTTGVSLNDLLYCGKNLQGNIFDILVRFRLFKVTLCADIKQMFLCIGVTEEDRKFQRILYRFSPQEPLVAYQFNVVCFGVKSSPFHAIRCIRQLAIDEGEKFPKAQAVLTSSLYMDDFIHSVATELEAQQLSLELISLMKSGQFDLVKWTSNSQSVLEVIPATHRINAVKDFEQSSEHKVLGLTWSPSDDMFSLKIHPPEEKSTKRYILSCIARIWDVMGYIAPVVLSVKLLIKELWVCKCDWDDYPPEEIVRSWKKICKELHELESIRIPRHVGISIDSVITLVGFADASEKAFGGVVYFHVRNGFASSVHLISAKSKVAPLKVSSLARLELCAALVLAQLIKSIVVATSDRIKFDSVIAFSDSTVALSWIHSSPHRWATFVANRVSQIQEHTLSSNFYHVAGTENPADCLSRGLTPAQIIHHPLWFSGPAWLYMERSKWPIKVFDPQTVSNPPEQKDHSLLLVADKKVPLLIEVAARISSWPKLLRVIVYVNRFLKRLPYRKFISASDLMKSEFDIVRSVQSFYFREELSRINKGKPCLKFIQRLCPFIKDGIIRVGGRLARSSLDYETQHPILLPRNGHIVEMLIDYHHKVSCHAGPDLLMSLLRQNYWILSARNIVRSRVFRCNACFRLKPKSNFPIMADLKACRVVEATKPFVHTGTDFAGPILVSTVRGRGVRPRKAYICMFVCLTTRAVHIELATELSTSCFLSAFKRFLARRGPVSHLYSDNGTNYVGAKRQLDELHTMLKSSNYNDEFTQFISENLIQWHLNPPAAPHFNGNSEAQIKSLKTHLFRVIGKQVLSMEEMATVLTQVEAIMNSRPLCRTMTSDPSENLALSPAHFLNQTPLKYLPAKEISDQRLTLSARHLLLDQMVQSFWNRWRLEYLHTLQLREKWNISTTPILPGTVVILIVDNAPTLHWPLGIVDEVFSGADGVVRTARIRTSTGSYLRPVVRLCPLPNQ